MEEITEPMDVDVSLTADDNAKNLNKDNDEIEMPYNETLTPQRQYVNRGADFVTGVDVFHKEEQSKMQTRAKRFGLQDAAKKSSDETADSLYLSMGIDEENEGAKNIRLNVLHMRGTEDMSTKDVFKYFEGYAPASIEWINDVSCNVVWPENISAARALLGRSKKIVGLSEKSAAADGHLKSKASTFDDENTLARDNCIIDVAGEDGSTDRGGINEIDDDNAISLKEVDCPLPPGFWRKGVDCTKSKNIVLRFATRNDKKQPRAEKMSDYYKKYGNPNFGGIRGLLTESRKRMYKEVFHPKSREADDVPEEDKPNRRWKNPWGDLSQTWGQNDSIEDDFLQRKPVIREQTSGVKERLGLKSIDKESFLRSAPVDDDESDSESSTSSGDSDEEWCKRSKVLRMRMHADDEEEKMLKKRIKRRSQMTSDGAQGRCHDLRSRLNGTKKPPICCEAIQVVVDNTAEKYRLQQPLVYEEEVDEVIEVEEAPEEPEEGEWTEEAEPVEEEIEEQQPVEEEEEKEEEEEEEDEDDEQSDDSEVSEKEVQGPQGSVIKVVPRAKPRVASTVWARLNSTISTSKTNVTANRSPLKGNSGEQLKGDLRSRLGYHNRGRSPLRIEVKNDKYAEESSGTE